MIAHWPGMDTERASRLLNALYLAGGLMVVHESAPAPGLIGRLLRRMPTRRG